MGKTQSDGIVVVGQRGLRSRLLGKLSLADRALIEPYFEFVQLEADDVLFEPGDDITHCHFPCDHTVATLLVLLSDGATAKVATIGCEGSVGGIVSLGHKPAFGRAVVQIGGPALRVPLRRLEAAKERSPTLRDLFARYADVLLAQVMQSVACSALHPIEARYCRLLLTIADRVGGDELPLTQEALASMLGVQRTYLTKVARAVQAAGLVEHRHGRILVRDQTGLARAACECHDAVERHFEAVIPGLYPAHVTRGTRDA